jgi:hypothetical protein
MGDSAKGSRVCDVAEQGLRRWPYIVRNHMIVYQIFFF